MSFWILFWLLMTVAVMLWYVTVTVYVAIRGSLDIREMLHNLNHNNHNGPPGEAPERDDP